MMHIPTHSAPTHPGEMLLEEFLKPMGISQKKLADSIKVPFQRVNEIVHGRKGVSPSTSLRLAKVFDTNPDFWLNLQPKYELYCIQKKESEILEEIQPCRPAQEHLPPQNNM